MSQDWAVWWKAYTHQPGAGGTLQVTEAWIWYSFAGSFCLSWDPHPLHQTRMNLPLHIYTSTICICKQIISTNRNLVAAVLDRKLEHPFTSSSWLTAVKALRDWWVWSTRSEVVSWQHYCIPVDPHYRFFWKCSTSFVMFLDRVARIYWQKRLLKCQKRSQMVRKVHASQKQEKCGFSLVCSFLCLAVALFFYLQFQHLC